MCGSTGYIYKAAQNQGDPPTITRVTTGTNPIHPVVYGSNGQLAQDSHVIDYGPGVFKMTTFCYPGDFTADPLDVEPVLSRSMSSPSPDDGSSSHDLIFRVHYWDLDGLLR